MVDDDPDVRQLLRRMLLSGSERRKDQQPIEVDVATDGEEALASLRTNPPDLVLLDVVLPGIDGWQVLAQKSQDAAFRDIPVIMVSAQDRAEQQLRSEAFFATLGDGLRISQLLQCTLGVSLHSSVRHERRMGGSRRLVESRQKLTAAHRLRKIEHRA